MRGAIEFLPGGLEPPLAPGPRGTSPVGSPHRISRRGPPPLRGLKGGSRPPAFPLAGAKKRADEFPNRPPDNT